MYNIPIKIEAIERRKRSTGLFHVLAGFFIIANAGEYLKQSAYHQFWYALPAYAVAALSLLYGLFRNRIDPAARYNHWMRLMQFLVFSLLGIFLLTSAPDYRVAGLFLWAVITVLFLFSERRVFEDSFLSLNHQHIIIPGYFSSKLIPWTSVEHVVIRPDYVTIQYPNNRYLQYEVLNKIEEGFIEKANQFCLEKLQEKESVH